MPEPEQAKNASKAYSEKSTDFEKMVNLTTLLGKMFFTIGVIIYTMGFLAANIYFGKFGVQTTSLLRANCFITGFWLVIPLFIISFAFFGGLVVIKSTTLNTKTEKTVGLFFTLFIVSGLFFALYFLAVKVFLINITYKWLYILFMALFIIGYIVLIAYQVKGSAYRARYQAMLWSVGFGGPLLLSSMIIYITIFVDYMYPSIPFPLGGAQPVTVQVFTDPNSEINNSFRKCGFIQKGDGVWEGKLLLASGDEYLFAVDDPNEGLCIRTQEVKAIKYHSVFKWRL